MSNPKRSNKRREINKIWVPSPGKELGIFNQEGNIEDNVVSYEVCFVLQGKGKKCKRAMEGGVEVTQRNRDRKKVWGCSTSIQNVSSLKNGPRKGLWDCPGRHKK